MTSDDPRAQPGCYVTVHGRLYCVEQFRPVDTATAELEVTNAATEYRARLSVSDTERCTLVKAAPTLDLSALPEAPDGPTPQLEAA